MFALEMLLQTSLVPNSRSTTSGFSAAHFFSSSSVPLPVWGGLLVVRYVTRYPPWPSVWRLGAPVPHDWLLRFVPTKTNFV